MESVVRDASWWSSRGQLGALFFLHGMALGMWFVPMSPVLDAHGLSGIKPYAFATSAVAALVSPLIFGAIADRHATPIGVLRWLSVATAALMAMVAVAIERGWSAGVVLLWIQLHALAAAPSWGLSTTIVLARLRDARREFGPLRAMGTLGWMAGCWWISALRADASTLSAYASALTWVVLAGFSLAVPGVKPVGTSGPLTVRQRLGLDALALLRNPDHRVVLVTAFLVAVPLAAFYPYTPPHMLALGLERTSAWMSVGQVTEILAMLGLGVLITRWRLKWIFACGLVFALLRYLLYAADDRVLLMAGVSLHGLAFTLFFVTVPIYLNERVDPAWRARAQALLSLLALGGGNLIGYLGSGAWFAVCDGPSGVRWTQFWLGLAGSVAVVLGYFLATYRGRGRLPPPEPAGASGTGG
ncbi:MAG: MFS transporter [Verrucomicrobiae bacterium]|nr:MFS transporter [Verrucomicrobiae bacterium]